MFPFTFSKNKRKTDNVGSYGRAIPGSLGPGSGYSYLEYNKKNMANTVSALIDSGQTVFGFTADDGEMGVSDGPYWVDFLELLNLTAGTGIKIFASVRERHLIKGIINRWGVLGGAGGGINRIHDPPYSSDSESALAWVAAATEFSALSLLHPHFIGFTIDDYGPVMSPTLGGYTEVETSNITTAAKSHNPDFKFWPTQYISKMLEQILPSTVIGMTSESRMYAGEYVATEFSFNVASESAKPTVAMLSFLFHDENQGGYGSLWKKFSINGVQVFNENTWGWQFIQYFNEDIADNIIIGDNKIRMEVYAYNTVSISAWKLLYIESPLLVFDNTKIITLSQTFDVMSSYRGFTALDDPSMDPNAPLVLPTGDAKIIAQVAPEFGKFSNNVDGFFAVYANRHEDQSASPATRPVLNVTDDAGFLCRKYKSAIGKKELHYIEQAYLKGKGIVSDNVINKFKQVSEFTSSTLTWNFPLDMYDLTSGVFSEKAPLSSSATTNLVILCHWPERQMEVPGWGQKWTTIAQYSGWITIKVKDNHITSGTTELFNKRISTSANDELYNDGTYGIEPDGSTAAETAEWVEYDLGPTPVNIIFEVSIVAGVGNSPVIVQFGMRPGKIDGTGAGTWLVNGDFSFSNNVIDDVFFTEAYTDIKAYFKLQNFER